MKAQALQHVTEDAKRDQLTAITSDYAAVKLSLLIRTIAGNSKVPSLPTLIACAISGLEMTAALRPSYHMLI